MVKQFSFFAIFLLFLAHNSVAQSDYVTVPSPSAAQSEPILLINGTAHLGNGEVIENAAISFENGKITMVGDATKIKLNKEGKKVIDCAGKHIYPGLIAANTNSGLSEIGSVRATRDNREVGTLNPSVRSIISYNADSRATPTVRSNGVLLVQVVPDGGTISGSSSVVQLDAWNWEDAAYALDNGMHLHWPSPFTFKGWWAEPGGIEENKKYQETLDGLHELFAAAQAYAKVAQHAETNLKLEAMRGIFDKSAKLYIHTNAAKSIMDAIHFGKKYGVEVVIVGGKDSWQVTDILKETNTPVVLHRTHSLPNRMDEDIDIAFKTPKVLQDAGILYCITRGGGSSYWDIRNLPFYAGTAAAYGLTKEQALSAITLNAAQILGIADKTGSIEEGKDANIIVVEGDILDMRTSNVTAAYIQGRTVDLDNKQKALYRKFMDKYGLEAK